MASCNWVMVVSRVAGQTNLTVRGPETRATSADCPADGEWIGLQFKVGSFMPQLPSGLLRDRQDVTLPAASSGSFWLDDSAWEYPTYENAETFVARLLRRGLIVCDSCACDVVRGAPRQHCRRTEQRRVLRATGLTPTLIRQIDRARRAVNLLRDGSAIVAAAHDAGYFDQAHLTRSLIRFIGQSPAQVVRGEEQLSLLYNIDDA